MLKYLLTYKIDLGNTIVNGNVTGCADYEVTIVEQRFSVTYFKLKCFINDLNLTIVKI